MHIQARREGGTVSIPGVHGGIIDKFPIGAAFTKGLTLRMGQTHTHRCMRKLLARIAEGEIDTSFVVSHRLGLADAPGADAMFQEQQESCDKVVLKP